MFLWGPSKGHSCKVLTGFLVYPSDLFWWVNNCVWFKLYWIVTGLGLCNVGRDSLSRHGVLLVSFCLRALGQWG